MRRPCCALAAAALLLSAGVSAAADRGSTGLAAAGSSNATSEEHRRAIASLEQAAKLAPRDPTVLAALGRAYLDAGYTHDAEVAFAHVTELAPDDAGAWELLALAWKRDWLTTLAPESRDRAVSDLEHAVRLDSSRARSWTLLAVLRVEQGDARGARLAADAALAASPESTDAELANAYVTYRSGRLARAESLFTVAIPRLPRSLSARFADISPLLPPRDGEDLEQLSPAQRAEQVRRFWSSGDPDPTTRVNEARLEYWARIAHATLLFRNSRETVWDRASRLRGCTIRTRSASPRSPRSAACGAPATQSRCGTHCMPSSGRTRTSGCSSSSRIPPSRSTTGCRGPSGATPTPRPTPRDSHGAGCSPPREGAACSRRCLPASIRFRSNRS
jgi:cytochrome c-type biogenesis protein CcmH/NrfG